MNLLLAVHASADGQMLVASSKEEKIIDRRNKESR